MPRRKRPESLKPWKEWTEILIEGQLVDRIRYKPGPDEPEFCDVCKIQKGSFHKFGCMEELSPCKRHKFLVECDCNVRKDEEV